MICVHTRNNNNRAMKNKKLEVCLFVCLWIEVLCYVVPLQLIVLREFQSCLIKLVRIFIILLFIMV
jgi:hypothetical protein